MSYKPRLTIDALVFSVNDVLVDVSLSYREVVRETVQLYLERTIGLPPSKESLLTSEEVTLVQKVGHFTSYVDLASAFIIYFIELLPPVPIPTFPSKFHVPALIAYLQLAGGRLHIGIDKLREQKDIPQLAQDIAAAGGGIDGANAALQKENRHLLVDTGDITKGNLVGRIFQELYLGADLFERIYEQPAVLIQSTGYIEHESLLIDLDILAQINDKVPLGAVTDRSRIEVKKLFKTKEIDQYFQSVVSADDVREAKAKPIPDPWSLLEAARRLNPTPARTAYVGANPGDIQAAKAANQTVPFTAIGCLIGAHNKEAMRQEFEEAKADIILGHPNHLKELIFG